jgi:hypothetical protein
MYAQYVCPVCMASMYGHKYGQKNYQTLSLKCGRNVFLNLHTNVQTHIDLLIMD